MNPVTKAVYAIELQTQPYFVIMAWGGDSIPGPNGIYRVITLKLKSTGYALNLPIIDSNRKSTNSHLLHHKKLVHPPT
jgi:hypothetical protein